MKNLKKYCLVGVFSVGILIALFPLMNIGVAALTVTRSENLTPENSLFTLDFELGEKLKKIFEPLLNADKLPGDNEEDTQKLALMFQKILAGDRFFVSFSAPQNISLSFPVTDDEFTTFKAGTEESTSPSGSTVYKVPSGYVAKIGDFAVIASGETPEGIQKAIDLGAAEGTASLANNAEYQKMTSSYLSPHSLSFTYNVKAISELMNQFLASASKENTESSGGEEGFQGALPDMSDQLAAVKKTLDLFEFFGMSFGETENGYSLEFKLQGNEQAMTEQGYSLNPGGNFIPRLYKNFPPEKPIFYSEMYNPNANYTESKKLMSDFFQSLNKELQAQLGMDFDTIYAPFDKEIAVGIQYHEESPLPFITLMADVSNHKDDGKKLTDALVKAFTDALKEDSGVPENAYKITEENGFTKVSIDVTKFEDFDGPPFPKITITVGVSEDGLLIVSNYPGIEESEKRTGFGSDADFSGHQEITESASGISYVNVRNVWAFLDGLTAWGARVGGTDNAPPLEFYQGYYSVLDQIYGLKDIMFLKKATLSDFTITGNVTIDTATHKTYEELISELKSTDSNNDGVSDYDSIYVYHTSASDTADSDSDGVSDIEELQKGENPDGGGQLFTDVAPDTYYTSDVALLYKRGAISGYDDKSFRPGQLVNRAEFTAMIVRSFEKGTSKFLGIDIELKSGKPPFADVDMDAWYYDSVAKAYAAGFVSGSQNNETGEIEFRPGAYITRAEALVILSRASKSLLKTQGSAEASCNAHDSNFEDVSSDDWFCEAVSNGYLNGITSGKTPKSFKPYDNLNRAEAAVLIRRTLEKDLETASAGTESIGELASPVTEKIRSATSALPSLLKNMK